MQPANTLIIIGAAILLMSCSTTTKASYVPVETIVDPCPAEGLADVPSTPIYPLQQPAETNIVYSAIAKAVGNERAQVIIRYWESELPAWGWLANQRVIAMHDWCVKRNAP